MLDAVRVTQQPAFGGAHRVGVLGPDGEAVGPSFTIAATQETFTEWVHTLHARGVVPGESSQGGEPGEPHGVPLSSREPGARTVANDPTAGRPRAPDGARAIVRSSAPPGLP